MSGRRSRILRQLALNSALSGGPSDTTRPACAITSAASTITAAAFSVTITFTNPETGQPEAVTGFALGDITCSANASAGTLANPSTGVYTATITPTATGTVTVDVAADVCTDAAGNNNTAATQFSILYVASVLWLDASDLTTLFQDAARTSAVTADGQFIHGIADKSGSGSHGSQAGADGITPIYKTNIQNSKSAAQFIAASSKRWQADGAAVPFSGADKPLSVFIVCKLSSVGATNPFAALANTADADTLMSVEANLASNYRFLRRDDAGTSLVASGGTPDTNAKVLEVVTNGTVANMWSNGSQIVTNFAQDVGTLTTDVLTIGARITGGSLVASLDGYVMEILLFSSALTSTPQAAVRNYLNTKWSVF